MRTPVPLLLAAAALYAACARPPEPLPTALAATALIERVGSADGAGPVYCRRDRVCGSDVLPGFYGRRGFRPAWIDDGLRLAAARSLIGALRGVERDGLDPANYHLSTLESLVAEVDAAARRPRLRPAAETLADLEMLLTDAFLLCGSHLVHGQVDPETVQSDWSIKGRVEDLAAALERGLAAGDTAGALDSLRPSHAVYRGLLKAYGEYAAAAAAGSWPEFPAGPKLAKGARDGRVESLRRALAARGEPSDPAPPDPSDLFDEGLERTVIGFQRRHGLEPDGVVGAGTAAALNVTAAERLKQIRANLERWRWITPDLGERYVMVNVADYRVAVYEAGREVLGMAAVVGRAYRQTPDFSGQMSAITLNPTWTVPPKLAREDILPKLRKDPAYLKTRGFRVFENWTESAKELDPDGIAWDLVDPERLSFKFRQDPGPQNALGRMMFLFPNKYDVYIHDTPERGLFGRAVRDFSSGCIRVEKPFDLAAYVLRDDPAWTMERIADAISGGTTLAIPLRERLRVHVLYWTAWLGEDGRVQFRRDIYLRDEALDRALSERAAASPR